MSGDWVKSNNNNIRDLCNVCMLCLQTYPHGSEWCLGAWARRWSRSLSGCEFCPGRQWCAPCGSTWSPPEIEDTLLSLCTLYELCESHIFEPSLVIKCEWLTSKKDNKQSSIAHLPQQENSVRLEGDSCYSGVHFVWHSLLPLIWCQYTQIPL